MTVRVVAKLRPSAKQSFNDLVKQLEKTEFHLTGYNKPLPDETDKMLPCEVVETKLKGGQFSRVMDNNKSRIARIYNDKQSYCFDVSVDFENEIITIIGVMKGNVGHIQYMMINLFQNEIFCNPNKHPIVGSFKPSRNDMCLTYQYRHSDIFVFFKNSTSRAEALSLLLGNHVFTKF